MITIGIDPGLTGAIGILRNGSYRTVQDMPTVIRGATGTKREVNPVDLMDILREFTGVEDARVALEKVNAMPGQGVSGVFSFGDSFGTARTAVAACRFETVYVAPQTWKKHFKLDKDKERSRALAIRMFPGAPLNLKKHDGRAEALLMARWLFETRFK